MHKKWNTNTHTLRYTDKLIDIYEHSHLLVYKSTNTLIRIHTKQNKHTHTKTHTPIYLQKKAEARKQERKQKRDLEESTYPHINTDWDRERKEDTNKLIDKKI